MTATPRKIEQKQDIIALAKRLGFAEARIASATDPWLAGMRLDAYLDAGRHGEMAWMETHRARRRHPSDLWPEVKSALVVGLNYGPDVDPLERLAREEAVISVYAEGDDYHDLIKPRLIEIARRITQSYGGDAKAFVDTAPLMEKPLAERAGLGWQGKHTNLVSRTLGSWLLLGVVLTNLDLPPDAPETDHCGSCRACLDICPTNAFPAPRQLDARACLSYLTIEHKGPWPRRYRDKIGPRIYGCDDCLAVCPWNKFAQKGSEAKLQARETARGLDLAELSQLDDAAFRARFSKSPVKRTGRDRFLRNVLYALGARRRREDEPAIRARLSDDASLVRGAAVWALSQILPMETFAQEAAAALAQETDISVQAEWRGGADAA